MAEERPHVGIGILVVRDGKVLLGVRKGKHGHGTYCLPGGHMEYGESLEQTAARELKEETGLVGREFKLISISNLVAYDSHYITIGFKVEADGEAQELEEAIGNWDWYNLNELPEPMFEPAGILIKNYLNKRVYSQE